MFDDLPTAPLERLVALQELLISHATNGRESNQVYQLLRSELIQQNDLEPLVPQFVRTCRTLDAFWGWIKGQSDKWAPRRAIIRQAFAPLLDHVEFRRGAPLDTEASAVLERFDPEAVHLVWAKALQRRETDPEGAITAARTLVETVCKHILEDLNVQYGPHDDLPKLYGATTKELKLAPSQYTEEVFKVILGGCHTVINGLSSLRNKIGDAHGTGPKPVKPTSRHAALAVNLAGAMATFLVETAEHRRRAVTPPAPASTQEHS